MRRGVRRSFWVIAALSVLGALVAGCGGGSGSGSGESTTSRSSAPFPSSKSDAKFVKFGSEASAAEREAANSVLETNLKARAAADFKTQCATLNGRTQSEIASSTTKDPASACPAELKNLAAPLPATKKIRANTLGEPIAELRIKGDKAWALYHGNNGKDYAIPMEKEGGAWKVGALLATEL